MPTAAEAKSAIDAGFAAYIAELEQAAAVWDKKPEGSADGEGAWCARQVAEHIAGAGPFFGQGIAAAIGVSGPTPSLIQFPDASNAVAETKRTHGLLMDVVAQVSDAQMAMEVDHPRLGKQTLGGILGIVSYHLNDHANQLKTLRTS
jgi:hypothetical protein